MAVIENKAAGVRMLELLAEMRPYFAERLRNQALEMTRKHFAEIEKARGRGYSWRQIKMALRQAYGVEEVTWINYIDGAYKHLKAGEARR